MAHRISIRRRAQKKLGGIQERDRERIISSISGLASEPRPTQSRKLRGREAWRLRVGDYRAIYEIDDEAQEVLILDIGHRRDINR